MRDEQKHEAATAPKFGGSRRNPQFRPTTPRILSSTIQNQSLDPSEIEAHAGNRKSAKPAL
jgi:hypothetical protein